MLLSHVYEEAIVDILRLEHTRHEFLVRRGNNKTGCDGIVPLRNAGPRPGHSPLQAPSAEREYQNDDGNHASAGLSQAAGVPTTQRYGEQSGPKNECGS